MERDVGRLVLLVVWLEGVAEGFLFSVLGKEAGEGVDADNAIFYPNQSLGQLLCIFLLFSVYQYYLMFIYVTWWRQSKHSLLSKITQRPASCPHSCPVIAERH